MDFSHLRKLTAFLVGPFVLAACATLVGYDELTVAGGDGSPVTDSRTEAATDGVVTDGGDGGLVASQPPGRPTGDPKPSPTGKTLWFAVKRFRLGSQNAAGVVIDGAWREWGYDIDRVCTSTDDSIKNIGTCRRVAGAKQESLQDGNNCRDNNFGQHVIALARVASDGFEARLVDGTLGGNATLIIKLEDVDEGADDPYVPAKLYSAADLKGVAPKWDGTDVRTVTSDSLIDGTLDKPLTEFPRGYLVGNVWVSGEPGKFTIPVPVADNPALMRLEGGVTTFKLAPDRKSASGGVISGALPLGDIEAVLKPIAISAGLCPGSAFYESTLKTVKQYPDLVSGAPNMQDQSVECNAMSVGLGFDIAPIQPVVKVDPPPTPAPGKCGDAG